MTTEGVSSILEQISENLTTGLTIKNKIVGQSILGDEKFVSWAQETFLEKRKDRERPDIGKIHSYLSKNKVLSFLEIEFGVDSILTVTGTNKQIVMSMLYKYAALNNREIGDLFGIDYSTVSQGRKRLRDRVAKDQKTKINLHKIELKLSRIKI